MELKSIEALVAALDAAKVQYLLVGGLAVNAYGYQRLTQDVDIVIGLQPDNILRGLRALQSIGYQMAIPVTPEQFADPTLRETWRAEKNMVVLKLWSDRHRRTPIDIFVYEPFDFAREHAAASWLEIAEGQKAPVISYKALIEMKLAAGRDRDLLDVSELRKLEPYR